MLRFILFLFVFGLSCTIGSVHSGAETKLPIIKQQPADRLTALLELPYDVFVADLDQAQIWADSMILLAKKLKLSSELARAHQKRALVHYYRGAYEACVADHMQSITLFQRWAIVWAWPMSTLVWVTRVKEEI